MDESASVNPTIKIGSVCKCRNNVVGVVTKMPNLCTCADNSLCKTNVYKGINLEGNPWQSKSPTLLANNLVDYFNDRIKKREISKYNNWI